MSQPSGENVFLKDDQHLYWMSPFKLLYYLFVFFICHSNSFKHSRHQQNDSTNKLVLSCGLIKLRVQDLLIYLKEGGRGGRRKRKRKLSSVGSLPTWSQQPALGPAKPGARSIIWVSDVGARAQHSVDFLLLFLAISRKLLGNGAVRNLNGAFGILAF